MPEGDGGSRVDAATVDDAIAQVLQAERDARDNVQHCAREAEGIVERAHETARQIARRAAHRSVRVQRWSASALQRQLAALAQLAGQGNAIAAHADSPGALQRAVEELAAQLTGASR
jgi:vacuolar-type H+-ATPase subunit H